MLRFSSSHLILKIRIVSNFWRALPPSRIRVEQTCRPVAVLRDGQIVNTRHIRFSEDTHPAPVDPVFSSLRDLFVSRFARIRILPASTICTSLTELLVVEQNFNLRLFYFDILYFHSSRCSRSLHDWRCGSQQIRQRDAKAFAEPKSVVQALFWGCCARIGWLRLVQRSEKLPAIRHSVCTGINNVPAITSPVESNLDADNRRRKGY